MYEEDDPGLVGVRRVCLALPEAVEVEAWGRPSFRAGATGRMFAMFQGNDEHPFGIVVKAEPGEREALAHHPRCWVPWYWGSRGWIGLDLVDPPPDWDEVAELVVASYRQVALKRQLRALGEA
ncbi:MAG TPA: MmcQ/YjbR family DNA-binding protein [Mycobacteriales bacterium]